MSHLNFSGSSDNCLNCPASARIISSFDFKHRTAYNILSYNLATVLRDQGDLKQAKEYHEHALAIRQQTLGPQNPDVPISYNNLGNVLGDQGDLKQAKEYHERALAIRQQTLGPQHPDVATSYNNLAIVLRDQGNLKQAKKYHERALTISSLVA